MFCLFAYFLFNSQESKPDDQHQDNTSNEYPKVGRKRNIYEKVKIQLDI